jgi:hypothetical protein
MRMRMSMGMIMIDYDDYDVYDNYDSMMIMMHDDYN